MITGTGISGATSQDFESALSMIIGTQITQILQMPADLFNFFNLCKSIRSVSSACKKRHKAAVLAPGSCHPAIINQ